MLRSALLSLALCSTSALASEPDLVSDPPLPAESDAAVESPPGPSRRPRPASGLVVRLEPGYLLWSLDAARLESQLGSDNGPSVRSALVDQTQNGFGLLLHVGYNILGHATIGLDITATGWDVGSSNRGGAGFVAGSLAWHPLALLDALDVLKDPRWRDFDASFFFGAGYGAVGEQVAMDGLHYQLGLRAEYFLGRHFSVGLALRYYTLKFHRYVLNWLGDVSVELPQGSGGSALMPTLTLAVHGG